MSCFSDLLTRPDRAVLAVRWETSLFPVLDADLTLIPAGPRGALLQLVGVYWTRSDEVGQRVATVTIGGFLSRIVETIRLPPPDNVSRDLGPWPSRFFGPSPRRPRIATFIPAMRTCRPHRT
jgi:hypothetical protein